jgi:hypothetical protein
VRCRRKKEIIFFGPQITQLFEDQDFSTKLNSTERNAWKAFEMKKKENYSAITEADFIIQCCGCNMSL